jgi:DNA polymerase-4
MLRKIIHVDMDAFFASVEQRDHPELRGKPIAVGFDGPRGVVSTASYEARRYGIHSAQPIATAKRRCADLIIVSPHYDIYKKVSAQIHDVFHEYTDLVEPLSLDEAFLDVTQNKRDMEMAVDIAKEIKQKIYERTSLTASAGVSYNKFLAKIASDWRKPNGLTTIHPDRAQEFIAALPIEKFWGVGPHTAERMHRMGVFNGAQLREISLSHLTEVFGKNGAFYYDFARGIDNRSVVVEHERKSVGCEQTFLEDLTRWSQITIEIYHLVQELVRRIEKSDFKGHTLTLKVKYADFKQITRSVTQQSVLTTKEQILPLAKQLLNALKSDGKTETGVAQSIRLLGLAVSHSASEVPTDMPMWEEGWLDFRDVQEGAVFSPHPNPQATTPHSPAHP